MSEPRSVGDLDSCRTRKAVVPWVGCLGVWLLDGQDVVELRHLVAREVGEDRRVIIRDRCDDDLWLAFDLDATDEKTGFREAESVAQKVCDLVAGKARIVELEIAANPPLSFGTAKHRAEQAEVLPFPVVNSQAEGEAARE